MAANEPEFLRCDLSLTRTTSKAVIRWHLPAEVITSVQLPGQEAQSSALRGIKWRGVHPDADAVQRQVAALQPFKTDGLHDYALYVKSPDGTEKCTVQWSAARERTDLAEVRVLLERIGHLACTEAQAYLERGQALAQYRGYAQANKAAQTSLALLAELYQTPEIADDTSVSLVRAETYEKTGQGDLAWKTYENVLRTRLAAYQNRYGLVRGRAST
jgi:hypothetical protein